MFCVCPEDPKSSNENKILDESLELSQQFLGTEQNEPTALKTDVCQIPALLYSLLFLIHFIYLSDSDFWFKFDLYRLTSACVQTSCNIGELWLPLFSDRKKRF